MRWSEPFMQSRSSMRKDSISATLSRVRRTRALASSGRAAPLPYPTGRYSARTDDPSGASHTKAFLVTDEGTPRHTTVSRKPPAARICGICAMWPNMSGRYPTSITPPKAAPRSNAHLQVSPDRLARGEELVHQDVPRADTHPAGRGQGSQPPLHLGPHLEVVVDDRHLPVEHEVRVAGVGLEQRDQRVDQLDQRQAEVLVRLVPFPVPMGVRHDGDTTGGHDRQTMTPPGIW